MSAQDILNRAVLDSHGYPKPVIELPAYSWPGAYTIVYLTFGGSWLCADCATKEIRAWLYGESDDPPVSYGAYDEGPTMQCDDCNRDIESSYGDPDEENS